MIKGRAALRYLSLGCGLESSTIAEITVEGELPPVDLAIFVDTGADHPGEWAHIVRVDNYLRTRNNFTAGMRGDMYLYRGAVPLEEADLNGNDAQVDFFEVCDGFCFV